MGAANGDARCSILERNAVRSRSISRPCSSKMQSLPKRSCRPSLRPASRRRGSIWRSPKARSSTTAAISVNDRFWAQAKLASTTDMGAQSGNRFSITAYRRSGLRWRQLCAPLVPEIDFRPMVIGAKSTQERCAFLDGDSQSCAARASRAGHGLTAVTQASLTSRTSGRYRAIERLMSCQNAMTRSAPPSCQTVTVEHDANGSNCDDGVGSKLPYNTTNVGNSAKRVVYRGVRISALRCQLLSRKPSLASTSDFLPKRSLT